MKNWFEDAPDWCQVVIYWKDADWTIYLETDEKDVSGRLKVVDSDGDRVVPVDETPVGHIWWSAENQSQVVATRSEEEEPRYLTEEEVAILSDLGLLGEALSQQGVQLPIVGESRLSIVLWDSETEATRFSFQEDTEGSIANVEDFFNLIEEVYYELGFRTPVTISSDCPYYVFSKTIGQS